MSEPRVIAIVGPTAVGKTALALSLSEELPVEVVSADSRTVYRWMDIGTSKPTPEERHRLPHHVIDVVDPDEPYSLAVYQRQALAAIERIHARDRQPLLVGGAGLYISAVTEGLSLPDVAPNSSFRTQLEALDWATLQRQLREVDPVSAERIDPKNKRRVIRALEVYHETRRPFSEWQKPVAPPVESLLIGLRLERAELNARIDARIDGWMASGFIEEVRDLLGRGYQPGLPSMSGIGYREVAQYLTGSIPLDDAVAQVKLATRQYARRQMTWFGARPSIHWFDAATPRTDQVLQLISSR